MLILKAKQIRPYEEKVLSSGLCDFSLPADFVTVDGVKSAVYDSSGYTCLDDIAIKGTDNILELLEKTLLNLDKAGEFLIEPVHIVLDGNTVFQDLRRRDVKFAYVPLRTQEPLDNIINIIDYLAKKADLQGQKILAALKRYIIGRNLSFREAARHVSLVRRELKRKDNAAVK